MSRFLFGSVPLYGHVNPTIGMAQQLISDGHTVAYACHPKMKPILDKAAIPYREDFQWGDAVAFSNETIAAGKKLLLPWILKKKMNTTPAECIIYKLEDGVRDFLQLIDTWSPDVCVFDTMFYPGILAAEIRGIPYAISCPTQILLPGTAIIPQEKGQPMKLFNRTLVSIMVFFLGKITRGINKVRKQYNLPLQEAFWKHNSPALYMAYTTEALEYKRSDLLPETYYIGPCSSRKVVGADVDFPWDWLDGRPVVFFTMGTVYIKRKIINQMIKAARGASWQLVITLGNGLQSEEWTDLPENVLIRTYLPQLALLEKVNAVVCTGGFGTVGQTLLAGVPIVMIPQILEHRITGSKLVDRKAGITISSWRVSSKTLRTAVDQLLNDPSYDKHAKEIAADFGKCNASVTAACLLENLASKRAPMPRPEHQEPTVYSNNVQEILDTAYASQATV
ncbi:MGT family glycosyltransferase [Chitinophaga niastensis]|uniref:MGT family glycosyltransferase n=1 Tax=Chitinophaga niastensis TaxID=536980 RepID=A0A2P8HPQ2_CHINA|nr:glycosyltransferase [Chitinophaga niastensis]PSL48182.1 MGT family glycosyltransferase [Chitinophaga niastensis]